ncbi:MAG TPA: DUF4440 domain-containing protein [Vicinamibacterales bacterium]|nr:DUF4440 domain-containing protein [Vicinamibacterales bacterium]
MRQSALCALAAALVLTAACGGGAQQDFTTQDAAAIRQENTAFLHAFNTQQVGPMLDLYTQNVVFMPPNAPIIRGKDALKSYYQGLIGREPNATLEMDVAEVSGSGPLAYQTGSYVLERKTATAGPSHDRGKYLLVLRHTGGTWRYEYSIWSSDLPLDPAPAN